MSSRLGLHLFTVSTSVVGVGTTVALLVWPWYTIPLLLAALCFFTPPASIIVVLLFEGFRGPLVWAGTEGGDVTMTPLLCLLTGTVGAISRQPRQRWNTFGRVGLVALVLLAPGIANGLATLSVAQTGVAVVYLFVPVLAYYVGTSMSARWISLTDAALLITLAANLLSALEQLRSRDAQLFVAQEYRTLDGLIRAAGFLSSDATLGLFAAGAFLWFLPRATLGRSPHLMLGQGLALALILLSTSRASLVLALASGTTYAVMQVARRNASESQAAGLRFARIAVIVAIMGVAVYAFLGSGSRDNSSYQDRLVVWDRLSGQVEPLGQGAGSVGTASYSSFAQGGGRFVDNAWLSLAIQYGSVAAVTATALLVMTTVRLYRRRDRIPGSSVALFLIVGISVSGYFIEIVDYVAVMTLSGLAVGVSRRTTARRTEVIDTVLPRRQHGTRNLETAP